MSQDVSHRIIAVIGLGYVGLPVAFEFAKKYQVIGYDKNKQRIDELKNNLDKTGELTAEQLSNSSIIISNNPEDLANADFFIVTVPTPITDSKQPDLTLLLKATELVANYLKPKDIVVYESTVYPGVTEEECLPLLEKISGLKGGDDFKVGYSPERINPGDREHTFAKIVKVVSAQDEESLEIVAEVYGSVVEAGVYKAPTIKTAEAAKVIENTQRDVNIALINELAIIFDRMNIDTTEVLAAAGTKWNFLPFKPGLVGGHCIGVDPYYLTYQAERYGYKPEVILAGRRTNDNVGKFVAQQTIRQMIHAGYTIKNARVGILGLTFKENCPDLRNSKVFDIIDELIDYGIECLVHDPVADVEMAKSHYNVNLVDWDEISEVDTIIIAVAHNQFKQYPVESMQSKLRHNSLLVDLKNILNPFECQQKGIDLWRL